MVKSLRVIEYFAALVVVLVFLLAVGKYYYPHIEKYTDNRERSFLIWNKKNIKEGRELVATYNLKLKRSTENGQWELIEGNGQKNIVFIVG